MLDVITGDVFYFCNGEKSSVSWKFDEKAPKGEEHALISWQKFTLALLIRRNVKLSIARSCDINGARIRSTLYDMWQCSRLNVFFGRGTEIKRSPGVTRFVNRFSVDTLLLTNSMAVYVHSNCLRIDTFFTKLFGKINYRNHFKNMSRFGVSGHRVV